MAAVDVWTASAGPCLRLPCTPCPNLPFAPSSFLQGHPCYNASKDLVIPAFKPPHMWGNSPYLDHAPNRYAAAPGWQLLLQRQQHALLPPLIPARPGGAVEHNDIAIRHSQPPPGTLALG